MVTYKCDRCGCDLDHRVGQCCITLFNGKKKLVVIKEEYTNSLDLCESCWRSFQTWFSKDLPPVEDTILGRQEDLSDPHPQETK